MILNNINLYYNFIFIIKKKFNKFFFKIILNKVKNNIKLKLEIIKNFLII